MIRFIVSIPPAKNDRVLLEIYFFAWLSQRMDSTGHRFEWIIVLLIFVHIVTIRWWGKDFKLLSKIFGKFETGFGSRRATKYGRISWGLLRSIIIDSDRKLIVIGIFVIILLFFKIRVLLLENIDMILKILDFLL